MHLMQSNYQGEQPMTVMQWNNTTAQDQALTLTTTIDRHGLMSFTLEGELIDHDGEPFAVGEFAFKPDRIEQAANYYAANFDHVRIIRATTWEK